MKITRADTVAQICVSTGTASLGKVCGGDGYVMCGANLGCDTTYDGGKNPYPLKANGVCIPTGESRAVNEVGGQCDLFGKICRYGLTCKMPQYGSSGVCVDAATTATTMPPATTTEESHYHDTKPTVPCPNNNNNNNHPDNHYHNDDGATTSAAPEKTGSYRNDDNTNNNYGSTDNSKPIISAARVSVSPSSSVVISAVVVVASVLFAGSLAVVSI